MYEEIVDFIRHQFNTKEHIPLHEPRFTGNEKKYVNEALDSTYVSSVGKFVDQFEDMMAEFTGASYAIATVNGSAALQVALKLIGVGNGDEVITQPLTFVATCNAIAHCNAIPVFVDVDSDTMGLSADKLEQWLLRNATVDQGVCVNKDTGRIIRACVPMHTFGHPARIDQIERLCAQYCIGLVEDAAESLGSYYKAAHTGTYGRLAAFSFNGNKTITTGGGGMIITDDESLARRARHLTTTAKVKHRWRYEHDEIGYNYRLPNLNAAMGCAQLEQLPTFLQKKRLLAENYQAFFNDKGINFVVEGEDARANYWLNAIILSDAEERDRFLTYTNDHGVMTRPAWRLMNELPMYANCQAGNLDNARWLGQCLVNIPSSVLPGNP